MIKAVSKGASCITTHLLFVTIRQGVVKNHLIFVLDIPFCMNGKFVDLLLL